MIVRKVTFFIKNFFSKCPQFPADCSHLLKKSLMENVTFCALLNMSSDIDRVNIYLPLLNPEAKDEKCHNVLTRTFNTSANC